MSTAKTPKGRNVTVTVTAEYGSARLQAGKVSYAGVDVSGWSAGGSGTTTVREALEIADKKIDELGLAVDEPEQIKYLLSVDENTWAALKSKCALDKIKIKDALAQMIQNFIS